MRRIILAIVAFLITITAFSQTSSGTWNSKTATYSNTKLGITWQLIEGIEWIGRPILTDDTLLKVRNDDMHILVTLGAGKTDTKGEDIWDLVSQYTTEEFKVPIKELAKHNGMTLQYIKPIRSQLCGKHAIKIKIDMTKYHPQYDVTVHSVEYKYQVVSGNYLFTLAVMGLSVPEAELEAFDEVAKMIFEGVSLK